MGFFKFLNRAVKDIVTVGTLGTIHPGGSSFNRHHDEPPPPPRDLCLNLTPAILKTNPITSSRNKVTIKSIPRSSIPTINDSSSEICTALTAYHVPTDWMTATLAGIKTMIPRTVQVVKYWSFALDKNVDTNTFVSNTKFIIVRAEAKSDDLIDIKIFETTFTQQVPKLHVQIGSTDITRSTLLGRRFHQSGNEYDERAPYTSEIDMICNGINEYISSHQEAICSS